MMQGEEVGVPASPTRTDPGSELFYDPMERSMSGAASTVGGEPLADNRQFPSLSQKCGLCMRVLAMDKRAQGVSSCVLAAPGILAPR